MRCTYVYCDLKCDVKVILMTNIKQTITPLSTTINALTIYNIYNHYRSLKFYYNKSEVNVIND